MGNSGLRAELSRGAFGSVMLKFISVLLGMVLAILLARTLGPAGYGIYAYVFSLISLLAIPAQMGLPGLVLRETAKTHAASQWGKMRGLWRWATLAVSVISIFLVLFSLIIMNFINDQFTPEQLSTFIFGLALVPLVALGNLRGAALSGLRRVVMGQIPEFVIRPGILILILISMIYLSPTRLSPVHAMGFHVVAATLSFVVGAILLWKVRPVELDSAPKPEYTNRVWIAAALPMALVTSMQLVNQSADIIMLGIFQSADEVGVYRVAMIGASLVTFGLQAMTMVVSPYFSRFYAQGDMGRLQRLVTLSSRATLFFSLPVVLVFVFFGDVVLLYIFGEEYISGWQPLAILSAGQLVNAAMGSVVALLIMSGHERETARVFAIAGIVNVILNFILIPLYGMNGAAIATTITVIVWNLILWKTSHHYLGIECMAFGIFKVKAYEK